MSKAKKIPPKFRVGDWVSILYGVYRMTVQIVEDRGTLGVGGRRLYSIRRYRDGEEPSVIEIPEEELEAVPAPEKDAILQYLKAGGLEKILRANLADGQDRPRVWLTFAQLGGLTHTFRPQLGVVGGGKVPSFALRGGTTFTAEKKEIIDLLGSFGLTEQEADEVLHAVGTAPAPIAS
jgi:hypothetical protein